MFSKPVHAIRALGAAEGRLPYLRLTRTRGTVSASTSSFSNHSWLLNEQPGLLWSPAATVKEDADLAREPPCRFSRDPILVKSVSGSSCVLLGKCQDNPDPILTSSRFPSADTPERFAKIPASLLANVRRAHFHLVFHERRFGRRCCGKCCSSQLLLAEIGTNVGQSALAWSKKRLLKVDTARL